MIEVHMQRVLDLEQNLLVFFFRKIVARTATWDGNPEEFRVWRASLRGAIGLFYKAEMNRCRFGIISERQMMAFSLFYKSVVGVHYCFDLNYVDSVSLLCQELLEVDLCFFICDNCYSRKWTLFFWGYDRQIGLTFGNEKNSCAFLRCGQRLVWQRSNFSNRSITRRIV